jgi:hypothetical protein
MYPHSEFFFPHHSIRSLRGLRQDEEWDALVRRVADLPELHEDSLAFVLMMIHACQCLKCDMGSYKASLGCAACAQRAISGEGATNGDWQEQLKAARSEFAAYLQGLR